MPDPVLVFALAERRFALELGAVGECLPLPELVARPDTPPAMAGFFVLSGRTVPVIDLGVLLGLRSPENRAAAEPASAEGDLYRHLVLCGNAALLVDRVLTVAPALPGPEEAGPDRWQHGCVLRRITVEEEPAILLDPDRILEAGERDRVDALVRAEERRRLAWAPAASG